MIKRALEQHIHQVSKAFPCLLLTGPRQIGKTTLLKHCASDDFTYVTLDNYEDRTLATTDPALFLQKYQAPLIIDEVQYAPDLFQALKIQIDQNRQPGQYWLTGSQKFHLMHNISESLAGRVAIIDMLGFSQQEATQNLTSAGPFLPTEDWIQKRTMENPPKQSLERVFEHIWLGQFPDAVQNGEALRDTFYESYIQTYIQRDIRSLSEVSDEILFYRFLVAVAARTGQLLNIADLARDVDINQKMAKTWLGLLEASGLVYLLQPFFNNHSKRLVKAPKLYFLDTGLCSYLTQWPTAKSLEASQFSGAILETYIFAEILKSYYHSGKKGHIYYYRDTDQREVDLVIHAGDTLYPVEFKKSATPAKSATRHFKALEKLGHQVGHGAVICFVESPKTLSESVMAVPVSYL